MKLLFLDIDGVLNDHSRWNNRWSGISQPHVERLNRILAADPELYVVLSSAWRYRFDNAWVTEALLCVHGVDCFERVHGVTAPDPIPDHPRPDYDDVVWWNAMGLEWRAQQIREYVAEHRPEAWIVLDDLPIRVENLVQTQGTVGLIDADVEQALALLAARKGRGDEQVLQEVQCG